MLEIPTPTGRPPCQPVLPDPSRLLAPALLAACAGPASIATRPATPVAVKIIAFTKTIPRGTRPAAEQSVAGARCERRHHGRAGGWRGLSGVGGRQPQGKESQQHRGRRPRLDQRLAARLRRLPRRTLDRGDEPHPSRLQRASATTFDKCRNELLRMGHGGCAGPSLVAKPCGLGHEFAGAHFPISPPIRSPRRRAVCSRPMPSRVSARAADR